MMGTVTGDVPPQLRDRDAWTGGWYELAMQLGETMASGFSRRSAS